MNLRITFFLSQFIIFFGYQCNVITALLGINVRNVKDNEFPFVVSLSKVIEDENNVLEVNHFCTGTLISNKVVITAEHCLLEKELTNVRVIVGSIDVRLGKRYRIFHWLSYNQWLKVLTSKDEFEKHDVAVLQLTEEVPNNIQPVPISNLKSFEIFGSNVISSGWGSSNTFILPILMETVALKIIPNNQCELVIKKVHRKRIPIPERILCSSSMPPAIVTYGDSGGPIFYNNTLVGITMGTCLYSGQPAHPGKINLHCAISYYQSFITDFLNNSNSNDNKL